MGFLDAARLAPLETLFLTTKVRLMQYGTMVSKNMMIVGPITSARTLMSQSRVSRVVYSTKWRMKPAAFITSMPFNYVMQAIEQGELFLLLNTKTSPA